MVGVLSVAMSRGGDRVVLYYLEDILRIVRAKVEERPHFSLRVTEDISTPQEK